MLKKTWYESTAETRNLAAAALSCLLLWASCTYTHFNVTKTYTERKQGDMVERLTLLGWTVDRVTPHHIETTWERYRTQGYEIEMRIVIDHDRVVGQCLQRKEPQWYARPCTLPAALERVNQI